MRTRLLMAAVLLPWGSVAAAQVPWVPGHLSAGTLTYRITAGGTTLDSMHVRLEQVAGQARPIVRISATVGGLSQEPDFDTITIDGATLAPIRLSIHGSASRTVDLDYRDTHVTGHVHFPYNGSVTDRSIDTVMAPGTLVDEQILWSLPALPLAAGGTWQLPAFSWVGPGAMTVAATVTGDTTVTVPAGTFPCWQIQATQTMVPITAYVTKTDPYLLVRYEMTGAPIAFELVRRDP